MTERNAANLVEARELSARFELGRLNVNTLLGNASVRADVRDAAQRAIRADLDRRNPTVPATVRQQFAQTLDASSAAAFRQRGPAGLSAEQRDTLAAVMADARLAELQGMADARGFISGSRASEVFRWLDSLDSNGSSRSFNLFLNPDVGNGTAPQLTNAGRVYKRILESTESDMRFNEEEFVAGFMNGAFNPQRFRQLTPAQVDVLRRAGIYDQLAARLGPGRSELPQELSPDALSRMFRRIDDKMDADGDGRSMTARGPQAASQRETPFPLEARASGTPDENDTYRTIRVLREVFDQRTDTTPTREEARPDNLLPPPAADLAENPLLRGRNQPLATRQAIDFDTWANYTRDSRLSLADIERTDPAAWRQLTEAFRAAGVEIADVRRVVAEGAIGGNADRNAAGAEWQRLHTMLAGSRFGGRNGVIQPWANGVIDGERTAAGRILEVIDRHTERFNLVTRQDVIRDLAAGQFQAQRLGGSVDTPQGRRPIVDVLREAGIDPEQLRRRNPEELASYVFEALGAHEANRVVGLRPNTLSLSRSQGGTTTETEAGRILGMVRRNLMQGYDQDFRAYTNRNPGPDDALFDASTRPVHIATQFSGYRDSDPAGCFRRAAETAQSSGVVRVSAAGGTNYYLANGANNVLGAIRGNSRHLTTARRGLDAMLDLGLPVQIAVMRRGPPGAAIGNPGSGVRHSLTIDQRGVDERGRVFYEGWDNATANRANARIRFFVDPRTNTLYAPTNPGGPVYLSNGGYQATMLKVPSWVATTTQLPGTRPDGRSYPGGRRGYIVTDAGAFFRHLTGEDIQGPMVAAAPSRNRTV